MITEYENSTGHGVWSIAVPEEVDAGSQFPFSCEITLPEELGGAGLIVSIHDQDDAEVASAALSHLEDDRYTTAEILLQAPAAMGEQVWQVHLLCEDDGSPCEGLSAEFSFMAKAHGLRLNVWDLPLAITAGEPFSFKAGAKCSSSCCLAGREMTVLNGEGSEVATAKLGDEVWPGTEALYYAEFTAKAPQAPGDYQWKIEVPALEANTAHAGGTYAFPFKVVGVPDCAVRIEVMDAESEMPIPGARIMLHPYRGTTGDDGVAELQLVKGSYKLLVSATRYMPSAQPVDIFEDTSITVELRLEPVIDQSSYYI